MRPVLFAVVSAASLVVASWYGYRHSHPEAISVSQVAPPEAAPLCPWRDPESDLKLFFPGADSYKTETRILSGRRAELAQRMGHPPSGDDNALHLNLVYRTNSAEGAILTRRVKGEFGAIEIVLATDTNLVVQGIRLQRLREPETNAEALQDSRWLSAFVGKRPQDLWRLGEDVPQVPSSARISAEAIVDGVKSLLILSEAASHLGAVNLAQTHRH